MKNFNYNENALADIDNKKELRPEYKKMLNNLLGISSRDNSTFTSSRAINFDLSKILDSSSFSKALNSKCFKVEIKNIQSDSMISDFDVTNNFNDFINIADDRGFLISIADRKLLEKDFEENKERVITKIKKSKNQKIAKWKRIKNKYQDIQTQTNSWPLFIGSLFFKVRTTRTVLYAPLVLKKVELEITNTNKVYIQSIDDSVEINEKLLFLLQNEYKFNLPNLVEGEKYSINDVAEEFSLDLEDIVSNKFNSNNSFTFFTKNDVKNQDFQFADGSVLMIASPSGGKLRDKLLQIMSDSDIDDLLDIDVTKNLDNEIIDEIQAKETIYRITPTDFSQEKAIHGSLKDHAIIWGPPGTGKSQTVANILANILAENKTAVVTSEKKAALDVIQKRMGSLSKYLFFGLTDKNVDKASFYKPFQDLINMLSSSKRFTNKEKSTYLSDQQWDFSNQKEKLSNEEINSLVNLFENRSFEKEIFANFNYIKEEKEFSGLLANGKKIETALSEAEIQKSGIIFRRYKKPVRQIIKFYKQTNSKEILKDVLKLQDPNNLKDVQKSINIEKRYKDSKWSFKNDVDYLDRLLAKRFLLKLNNMQEDPRFSKKVKTFKRNCISAYRIPYKFINIYSDIIKELFDVFISTPNTLGGIVNLNSRYNYAIFDEASQLHLEKAIPYISISDISIIAGDGQQMKPTSYFSVRDNSEITEDSDENVDSLLEFAERKGLKAREYMLNKNYRSKSSDLMLFSSKEFYESNLDVVDNKEMIGKESVEVYDVHGKWEGRINDKEAKASLDEVLKQADSYKKIILLTLNSNQKQYIESLIYNKQEYKEIIDMISSDKLFLRNLENIQGDEADLVIVSVAYDKTAKLGSTYVARPEGKNALNVAISRAIEKMIVFKSIRPAEVFSNTKNDSIRVFREWLEYLELNSENRKEYLLSTDKKSEQFDSVFEEDVYDYLSKNLVLEKDYFLTTQFKVGSYSIDMVIINSKTGEFVLGIEVDGYKYHSGFVKIMKDIERQKFIEAKGYSPIYRITELDWKLNKEKNLYEIMRLLGS